MLTQVLPHDWVGLRPFVRYCAPAAHVRNTLLLIAQIAVNNNASKTTHVTLFYANFRKDPNLFIEALIGLQTDRALETLVGLYDVYNKMR